MRLPRWTVYPAVALLAVMLVLAFPHPQADQHQGAARTAQELARKNAADASRDEAAADRPAPEAEPDPRLPAAD